MQESCLEIVRKGSMSKRYDPIKLLLLTPKKIFLPMIKGSWAIGVCIQDGCVENINFDRPFLQSYQSGTLSSPTVL